METAERADGIRVEENPEPPAPEAVFTVVNPLLKLLLRSPLHGLVSDALLVLEYTGRRSGKTYRLPVGYTQFDDTLFLFTHSGWWHNFEEPREVAVRLRGERRRGTASAITDPEAVAERLQRVMDDRGVGAARRLGFEVEGGVPDQETLADAIEETVAIEVTLD